MVAFLQLCGSHIRTKPVVVPNNTTVRSIRTTITDIPHRGEFRARRPCVWGILGYIFTQLAKMVFLATFVTLPDTPVETFDFSQELLKGLLNFADVAAVYFVLKRAGGSIGGDMKVLGVAIGEFSN